MSTYEYLLLFSSVLIGSGLAYGLRQRTTERGLQLVLALSGSYLLGITVLHLMPGIYGGHNHRMGLWLLLGFLIQLLLESLSRGVEHGHIHVHQHASASQAWIIMLGLCLHALLEGLPLGNYTEFQEQHFATHHHNNHLLWGIVLHKAPAAFTLIALLLRSGYSKITLWVCALIFASMSPLGAWISENLVRSPEWINALMGIVAGSFLHISTTILFEADNKNQHRISLGKLGVILIGMMIAYLTL